VCLVCYLKRNASLRYRRCYRAVNLQFFFADNHTSPQIRHVIFRVTIFDVTYRELKAGHCILLTVTSVFTHTCC